MKRQYAYFHAEGRSLEAIKKLESDRAAWEKTVEGLREKYGAQRLSFFEYPRTGKVEFWFADGQQPSGWETLHYRTGGGVLTSRRDGTVLCRPPEGSAEDEDVRQSLWGVFGRNNPARSDMLGLLLGAPEMPMKKDSGGRHEKAFVFLEVEDKSPDLFVRDPVCHARMNGEWYIRVPCDENGNARFMPPDSPERDYGQMLSLDRLERSRLRKGSQPAPRF